MRRVYILGAGASAGYENGQCGIRPPTARKFFTVVKALLEKGDLHRDRFSRLWEFLEKFYRVKPDGLDTSSLDIEEVLTMIDVAGKKPVVRRELLDLIVLTLNRIIYGNPCPHHRRLLDSLGPDDAIITFNWDLLLDNLVAQGGPNYGANMLEHVEETAWTAGRGRSAPLVLKVHGSLNWMTCHKCRKSFAHILEGKIAAQYHAGQSVPCRHCNSATDPLIIPPTLLKNYKHPVIKAVWNEAARVLRHADEITVVGYSLPLTDFKAKWLFMEASANRAVPLRNLTVVDLCADGLKDKYQRVFCLPEVRTVTGGIRDVPCDISSP